MDTTLPSPIDLSNVSNQSPSVPIAFPTVDDNAVKLVDLDAAVTSASAVSAPEVKLEDPAKPALSHDSTIKLHLPVTTREDGSFVWLPIPVNYLSFLNEKGFASPFTNTSIGSIDAAKSSNPAGHPATLFSSALSKKDTLVAECQKLKQMLTEYDHNSAKLKKSVAPTALAEVDAMLLPSRKILADKISRLEIKIKQIQEKIPHPSDPIIGAKP